MLEKTGRQLPARRRKLAPQNFGQADVEEIAFTHRTGQAALARGKMSVSIEHGNVLMRSATPARST